MSRKRGKVVVEVVIESNWSWMMIGDIFMASLGRLFSLLIFGLGIHCDLYPSCTVEQSLQQPSSFQPVDRFWYFQISQLLYSS